MRGLVELLDCLDDFVSFCTVLCACLLYVGIICVFCALFRLPNVGKGYIEQCLFGNVILLCTIFPATCASLGQTCTAIPSLSAAVVFNFGFYRISGCIEITYFDNIMKGTKIKLKQRYRCFDGDLAWIHGHWDNLDSKSVLFLYCSHSNWNDECNVSIDFLCLDSVELLIQSMSILIKRSSEPIKIWLGFAIIYS